MGRVLQPARKRSSNQRKNPRSILRFDQLTVPSSTLRLRPEGRKIKGQPAILKASYPNRVVVVQPYLRAGAQVDITPPYRLLSAPKSDPGLVCHLW